MNTIPGNSTIREFEYKLSDYYQTKYVMSVCNATIGILGVFYALGLKDAEIITTPLTWSGALSGPQMLNCRFRFCDVEPETLTINPELIESCISPNTKAVFTADFLGYPVQLDKIKKICQKHKLLLIHDAASSFGSRYKGRFSGYFADVTIASFGQKKIFSIGEGGCILTNNDLIYEKLAKFILHPERQAIEICDINPFALNTNLNPLSAKLGLDTFDKKIQDIEHRRKEIDIQLHRVGLTNCNGKREPNYYKILVSSELIDVYNNKSVFQALPFKKVMYDEVVSEIVNKNECYCPLAELAILEYRILDEHSLLGSIKGKISKKKAKSFSDHF